MKAGEVIIVQVSNGFLVTYEGSKEMVEGIFGRVAVPGKNIHAIYSNLEDMLVALAHWYSPAHSAEVVTKKEE